MKDSILNYYGLSDFCGANVQCYEFDYSNPIRNNLGNFELSDLNNSQEIVLVISIKATTISDRKMPLSTILRQRFGLQCDLLLEYQTKDLEGVMRICAVKVFREQFRVLLEILFDYSSCAFAFAFDRNEPSDLVDRLIRLFEDGVLTPKVTQACVSAVLCKNASFLHVLRGFDGYSINYFSAK